MTSPAGDALKFDSMVVDEGIGRMFEYTLDATSERGDLRPALLLGKMVTVKMEVPEKPVRYFSGYCARMQRGGMRGNFFSYTFSSVRTLVEQFQLVSCRELKIVGRDMAK